MTVNDITDIQTLEYSGQITYQVTLEDGTISCVPNDPNNSDYSAVQEWLALNG